MKLIRQHLSKYFYLGFILIMLYSDSQADAIKLTWLNNPEPDVSHYAIYRDTFPNPNKKIAEVRAPDTMFIDIKIEPEKKYYYRIAAVDFAGNQSEYSEDIHIMAYGNNLLAIDKPDLISAVRLNNYCLLKWQANSDIKNITEFEILKSTDGDNFESIGYMPVSRTGKNLANYQFEDKKISNDIIYYRVKQIANDGKHSFSVTKIVEANSISGYQLYQNYPNPFNAQTTISYRIPESGHVSLIIYNMLGRRIKTLVHKNQSAGFYEVTWDGKNELGERVPSGFYLYNIKTRESSIGNKMLIMK